MVIELVLADEGAVVTVAVGGSALVSESFLILSLIELEIFPPDLPASSDDFLPFELKAFILDFKLLFMLDIIVDII